MREKRFEKVIQVRVPQTVMDRLSRMAEGRCQPLSALVRGFIVRSLKKHEERENSFKDIPPRV